MIKRCSVSAALVLGLCACTSTPSDNGHAWVNYECSNGQTLRATYTDTNTAVIILNGKTHTLHIAISGSGARYTGEGWQWWTKGMHDGLLAPLAAGESIASAPGAACHAG